MRWSAAVLVAAYFLCGGVPPADQPAARAVNIEEHVYLIPAGDVDEKLMRYLKRKLPDNLPMTVRIVVEPRRELPAAAYDPARGKYNAGMVLDDAAGGLRLALTRERALVITDAPLYLPDFDHVYSVADLKKGKGLLSIGWLREGASEGLFRKRVLKQTEAALAEALGLLRCEDPRCVNFSSDDLAAIDKKRSTFCRPCEKKIRKRYDIPMFRPKLPF